MLPVFLGKITLLSEEDTDFTKPELEQAMKIMTRILLGNLRKGDIVCRYSPNQFLLLLTTLKDSNLQEGIRRIDKLFKEDSEFCQGQLEIEIVPLKEGDMEQ
jgi:GGDEF domain-containing protein